MDETLAELFVWHELAEDFSRNRMSPFSATIMGTDYGPNETPALIGLDDSQYRIVFCPGEYMCVLYVAAGRCELTLCGIHAVIDFAARGWWNVWLEVESGTREISNKVYTREYWRDEDLELMEGGCVFVLQMAGTGYVCHHAT